MSLQRCQQETTSTEFVMWNQYLRRDLNVQGKTDYALAQIAAEVRRVLHKDPRQVKAEDFLIRFNTGKPDKKAAMEKSKSFWMALVEKPNPNNGQA